jgi:hypothetical protein
MSVGMLTFPIYGKIKFMFQTTNQYMIRYGFMRISSNTWGFSAYTFHHAVFNWGVMTGTEETLHKNKKDLTQSSIYG